jgi:hypothetical protein
VEGSAAHAPVLKAAKHNSIAQALIASPPSLLSELPSVVKFRQYYSTGKVRFATGSRHVCGCFCRREFRCEFRVPVPSSGDIIPNYRHVAPIVYCAPEQRDGGFRGRGGSGDALLRGRQRKTKEGRQRGQAHILGNMGAMIAFIPVVCVGDRDRAASIAARAAWLSARSTLYCRKGCRGERSDGSPPPPLRSEAG